MNRAQTLRRARGFVAWTCFSPGGWAAAGSFLILLFGTAHLLGWREYTSVFSGTFPAPTPQATSETLATLGLLYATLYLLAILIAPVLILAAILRVALQGLLDCHRTQTGVKRK